MKILITVCLLLVGTVLVAQDVTTKKGKILFDKNEVASINKEKKIFKISSNDGSSNYSFAKDYVYLVSKEYAVIYTITDLNTNKTNTLFIIGPTMSLSGEKMLAKNLALESGFITKDGLNIEKFDEFLNGEKIDKEVNIKRLNGEITTYLKDARKKFNNKKFTLENWSVKNEMGQKVAYFKKTVPNKINLTLELFKYEPNGKATRIGVWSSTSAMNFQNINDLFFSYLYTINGEKIYIDLDMSDIEKNNIASTEAAMKILYHMTALGYFD